MHKTWLMAMLVFGGLAALAVRLPAQPVAEAREDAADEKAPVEKGPASENPLATKQRQVADRFGELERLLLRMAELTAPTDPRRAALLRQAVAQSRERDIGHQLDQLVELLRQERLAVVVKNQGEVQQDLVKLLELLLSEDRSKRIESEKERVREYLKRVNKIIKEQKSLHGETARGGDPRNLADKQGDLSEKTGELAKNLEQDAGGKKTSDEARPQDKQGEKDGDKEDGDRPDKEKDADSDKPGQPKDGEKSSGKQAEGKDADGEQGNKEKDEKQQGDKNKSDQDQPDKEKEKSDKKKSDQEKAPGKPDGEPRGKSQDQPPQQGEGQPSEGQPGEQSPQESPAQKRLEQAQQRMKEAQKKLEEAQREDAAEKQAEAIKELEQAKADLEEILRQLREEEMSRTLAMLEGRFRKMLDQQVEINEATKRLDKVPQAQRDRDDEIEAGRLSRKESAVSNEAEKALAILREEGSAVAFPEAVMEMRDDMEQVVARLAQAQVGDVTQGIEADIVAALEEMIAALDKAQKEMAKKDKQNQPPPNAEGDEPPLVDTLSELKMIRALQMRVNVRTQRYAKMTATEQADRPELLEALKRLAEREERIHKVTRDIVVGRNR